MVTEKRIYFFDNQQDWLKFKKKKEIKKDILHGHLETISAIEDDVRLIFTFDLLSLETKLYERNYRVFLKQKGYQMIEIKLGSKNNWTNRFIRLKTNFSDLYKSGGMTILLRKGA